MKPQNSYCVYMMASKSGVIYTGVTSNLEGRAWQHKNKTMKGFTAKYNVDKLVWYECTGDVESAIRREKQIKNWRRAWKVALIDSVNPKWNDLSEEWGITRDSESSSE
jgi:putative endonuclease